MSENPARAIPKNLITSSDLGKASITWKTSDPTQSSRAPSDLKMQGDVSGSGASERQRDQSSAKKSADSRSADTQKPSLTEAEYRTSTYLECRLSELRVRKIEMERDISALYNKMIEHLMKDVDDVKNRVQNDDHVGASRQKLLEECSKFQRELQQPWHTSLTEQQEYITATKKLKVTDPHEANAVPNKIPHQAKSVPSKDPHETKSVPSKDPHETKAVTSKDQHVYTRKCQESGLVPMESVEAHGHAQALTEKDICKEFDPLINSQATGRAGSDARADAAAADNSQRPSDKTDLPTGVDLGSIDLLLIGNCGNGKSATGNSILGRPAFRRTASSHVDSSSSTSSIKMESTEFAGKVVNVVDGPSIHVSGNITPDEVGNIIEKVDKSLELCKFSFTALLIILKFGERFTTQEVEALRVIKAVLGKDVVREYGVCVITYGDSFEYCMEEARESGEEMTFEGWLKEQKGEVTNLFEECNYRCVLFDNVTKDDGKRQVQLDKLMDMLPKGKRYSKDAFVQACESTQELEMEASLPTFLKEAQTEVDKIRVLIYQQAEIKIHDPEASNIKLKLRVLKDKVNKMRISSSELDSLKYSLFVLESNLKMKQQRWILERDIERCLGAQGKTSATSPTPALTDPTTMSIYKTPHDSPGTDLNRCMAEPSDFERDMPVPLGIATSNTKTSSSVDNSSHAFSGNRGATPVLPFNDYTTSATWQMHDTGKTDQHPESFVVIDKEMVPGESSASFSSIITKRVRGSYESS